jgi:hypothetical protein
MRLGWLMIREQKEGEEGKRTGGLLHEVLNKYHLLKSISQPECSWL